MTGFLNSLSNYLNVLKPRETALLTFIGVATAIVAGRGSPAWGDVGLAALAILIASAAANGLTNYLDRNLDALMPRTRNRALAAGRIYPAEKVLPLLGILTAIGLGLAWLVHPYAFAADLTGTVVAVTFRKKVTCVFPQGAIASCAPVLMGWFAIKPVLDWQIGLICLLIIIWLPSHVWGVMIARREEYLNAGITFFPMSVRPETALRLMALSSLMLLAVSVALYFVGDFGWLYLIGSLVLGVALVAANLRLLRPADSAGAWRVYKFSSFPYLGLLFLLMVLDLWAQNG